MIRLRLLLLTPLLFCILLDSASANSPIGHSGYYLGVAGAVSVLGTAKAEDNLGSYNLKSDPGTLLSLQVGYDLPVGGLFGNGRVELEYNQWNNDFTKVEFRDGTFDTRGSLKGRSLMLNSFATFPNGTRLTPYAGVGLGVAQLKIDQLTIDPKPLINDKDMIFAGQGGCGIGVEINSHLRLDLGYRYFASVRPELKDADGRKVKLNLNAHRLMLGLVLLF